MKVSAHLLENGHVPEPELLLVVHDPGTDPAVHGGGMGGGPSHHLLYGIAAQAARPG